MCILKLGTVYDQFIQHACYCSKYGYREKNSNIYVIYTLFTSLKTMCAYILLLLSTRVWVQLVVFCYKDIHVDRNEKDNRSRELAHAYSQLPPSHWLWTWRNIVKWMLYERPPKWQDKAYEGLPIYQLIKINLRRWQIALALMSSLEVHGAIEW